MVGPPHEQPDAGALGDPERLPRRPRVRGPEDVGVDRVRDQARLEPVQRLDLPLERSAHDDDVLSDPGDAVEEGHHVTRGEPVAAGGEGVPGEPRHRVVIHLDQRNSGIREGQRPSVEPVAQDHVERVLTVPPEEGARGSEGLTGRGEDLDAAQGPLQGLVEDLHPADGPVPERGEDGDAGSSRLADLRGHRFRDSQPPAWRMDSMYSRHVSRKTAKSNRGITNRRGVNAFAGSRTARIARTNPSS